MSVIRAFIAIELPGELQKRLDQVTDQLKEHTGQAAVRWVPAKNIHLTLKFLGDVSTTNLELLKEVMRSVVAEHTSFAFSVGGLGAFPTARRPRVIWVGVEAPAELSVMQSNLENRLARLGYAPEERPFSPHLTLGRVARTADYQDAQMIAAALQRVKIGFLGAVPVRQINLYRSDLQPNGAEYTQIYCTLLEDKHV